MVRASKRKHAAFGAMLAVLAGLSIAVVVAYRSQQDHSDTYLSRGVSMSADARLTRELLETLEALDEDELQRLVYDRPPSGDPGPHFSGSLNGISVDPLAWLNQRQERQSCPAKPDSARHFDESMAARKLAEDPAMGFASMGPLSSSIFEVWMCEGRISYARWLAFLPGEPSVSVYVERDRSEGMVTFAGASDRWRPLTIGALRGVVADPYIESGKTRDGCFAAVYEPATGVTTSVTLQGDSRFDCAGYLRELVGS